jgi:hypothetical protein
MLSIVISSLILTAWIVVPVLVVFCIIDIFGDDSVIKKKFSRWEKKPDWGIEYFGRVVTSKLMSMEEIAQKYNNNNPEFLKYMHGTEWKRVEIWGFKEWVHESKKFSSEKKAIRAFKRTGIYQDAPHVKFHPKCLSPGISKNDARQKAVKEEQERLDRIEKERINYNDQYTSFLESELEKMKELTE